MGEAAKWIKIATDTFEDEKIDIIEGMPSGDKLIITWFKLLLLAGKCNSEGYLLLQEDLPFNKEMLARRFKQEVSIIELAIKVFERYKMIEVREKGIYITNFNKHQNLDRLNEKRAYDRERKQKQRERGKLLLDCSKESEEGDSDMSHKMAHSMSRQNHWNNSSDSSSDSSYSASSSYSDSNSNSSNNEDSNINYIDFFNINFHSITEYELKVLKSYEEKGMEPMVITLALREAVEKNARDLRYVARILDRWLKQRILTEGEVRKDKAEFEKKKNSTKDSGGSSKRKPSTFNDYEQREYDYEDLEKQLLGWQVVENAV